MHILITCCVVVILFLLMGIYLNYYFSQLINYLKKLKIKTSQNYISLNRLERQISALETQMNLQFTQIQTIGKDTARVKHQSQIIESDYERAKSLMKRGVAFNDELLKRCNITEEEYQILLETVQKDEGIGLEVL